MVIFFPDSNLFLQCLPLPDLDWKQVSGGEEVLIQIPRTVQREIDKLKQAGNARQNRRARKATSFFRDIILAQTRSVVIRESDPKVTISLAPAVSLSVV